MNKTLRLLMLVAVALALFSSLGCDKLKARDQLNKGVKAYKDNHYEQAIDHFQQSVRLDPTLINARMYLQPPTFLSTFREWTRRIICAPRSRRSMSIRE